MEKKIQKWLHRWFILCNVIGSDDVEFWQKVWPKNKKAPWRNVYWIGATVGSLHRHRQSLITHSITHYITVKDLASVHPIFYALKETSTFSYKIISISVISMWRSLENTLCGYMWQQSGLNSSLIFISSYSYCKYNTYLCIIYMSFVFKV